MVWPIVAVAAASAAAQYYQAEKARGASEARLKELEREFNKLVPPEYDLSPMDPPGYIMEAIREPSYDMSAVTPEQYELVGKYTPEIAPYIEEQRPELVKETAAAREGRDAQLAALRRLRQISSSEADPLLAQEMDKAAERSQMEAQSRSASVVQDAQRRGIFGSGTALAAELQGNSDAMAAAAAASRDAAAESYRNRLQALRDSASLGGQIRGEDLDLEARNAGIINDFNTRTTRSKQAWSDNRAGTLNNAQLRNLSEAQRVAEANVSGRNDAAWRNKENFNNLQSRLYDIRARERDTRNDLIGRSADWRRGERDRSDRLRQLRFDNEGSILAAKQGLTFARNNMDMQSAADRNQAIQGVGNAGMSAYMYNQEGKRMDAAQDRADRRAYYQKTGYWSEDERRRAENPLGYGDDDDWSKRYA